MVLLDLPSLAGLTEPPLSSVTVSAQVSRLLLGLVDDAAMFPPASAPLREAVHAHLEHRTAWYADLVGPLLLPASGVPDLAALPAIEPRVTASGPLAVGLVGDTGVAALGAAMAALPAGWIFAHHVEVAVAKRGEDPMPGLRGLLTVLSGQSGLTGYAEIPLTWGLLGALDAIAEARAAGLPVAAK